MEDVATHRWLPVGWRTPSDMEAAVRSEFDLGVELPLLEAVGQYGRTR